MKSNHRHLTFVAALVLGGCGAPIDDAADSDGVGEAAEDVVSANGSAYTMTCKNGSAAAKVVMTARDGAFDLKATAGDAVLFEAAAQRPALNVRIEDGTTSAVNEYVDFNDKGLEVVAVDGPKAIEVDLYGPATAKGFLYKDPAKTVQLACRFDKDKLRRFLAFDLVSKVDMTGVKAVGFDIDDTLAFSTPTFVRAFATGGTPAPADVVFWTQANGCDHGCAAETITLADGTTKLLPQSVASTAKSKAIALVAFHKAQGHKVYAITARPDTNGGPLREYIEKELGIAKANVFFEPDMDLPGNPKGKTDRMESLDLDLFYGDSDSDITDAAKAFVDASGHRTKTLRGVRFLRSPKSSNRKAGKLNKYHPGYYGEPVIAGSYE